MLHRVMGGLCLKICVGSSECGCGSECEICVCLCLCVCKRFVMLCCACAVIVKTADRAERSRVAGLQTGMSFCVFFLQQQPWLARLACKPGLLQSQELQERGY